MKRGERWCAALAVLAILALLLAFDRVVRQGVEQGALRQATERARSNATWRCNALPGMQARADCRLALL
jgi:hypothetical protein